MKYAPSKKVPETTKKPPKVPPKKPPVKKLPKKEKPLPPKKELKPFLEVQVSEKGYGSYFVLNIVHSIDELCSIVAKKYKDKDLENDSFTPCGLVIEEEVLKEEFNEKTEEVKVCFAHCYLSAKELSYGIIAHEALHLALANERSLKRYNGGYPQEEARYGNCNEERLAYLLEAYVEGIIAACVKAKISIQVTTDN